MADSDFEDSFESSSESEVEKSNNQLEESKEQKWADFTMSYESYYTSSSNKRRSSEFEASGEAASSYKLGRIHSPKSSPLSRRKFRPHFKIAQAGLGNLIKKRKKKIFGISLQTAVYRSELGSDGIELPTIFRQCIDYLEENSLEQEGIYRLAGVKSQIDAVKTLYDKETDVDLSDYDPNTVASLLKLYLRELPEPLIPLRYMPKYDAAVYMESSEMQLAVLRLLIDELPLCNRLLLAWLFIHMSHISDRSTINKMGISNLVIVFSPTLQVPIPIMHLLYNHRDNLFPNVELKKYQRPQKVSTAYDLPDPSTLETEEEVTAELTRLNDLLEKLHTKVHSSEGKYDERDEYCWELQRIVTELKRKKKVFEQLSASKLGDEQEFMKALILMAATLQAENDELKATNAILKDLIRTEMDKVDGYQRQLKLYQSRHRYSYNTEEFEGDEAEFGQMMSKLLWQKREAQTQYNDLIKKIQEEEANIMKLRVKLRVAPLENQ